MRTLAKVRDDNSRGATSYRKRKSSIHRDCLFRMYHRTGEDVHDGFGTRPHPDSESKLWIKYTEVGQVLDVKIISNRNVCGIKIQISSTSVDNTEVCLVTSRTSNRCVDELQCKESEDLPEKVAQECMQDQEHSQSERSEDCIPIHKGLWDHSTDNEFSHGYKWEHKSRNVSVN